MSFQHPYALLLLILPPILLALAIIISSRRSSMWSDFVAARLRPSLIRRASPLPRWISLSCLLLAIALMALGLARFQILSAAETETNATEMSRIGIAYDPARPIWAKKESGFGPVRGLAITVTAIKKITQVTSGAAIRVAAVIAATERT